MLCIQWDRKGVLYYELILENQTINCNKYCSQLDQQKTTLDEKHPELVNRKCIIFHQDNARPHVSLMTRQKLLQLGWEVLIHLPYSPDISPLDFHLFSLYKILLMEKTSIPGRLQKSPGIFLSSKWYKILGSWNYEVAWKMAEGSGTKQWICCSIKLLVKMKDVSF